MSVLDTIRNSFGFSPPKVLQPNGKPAVGSVSSPVKRYEPTAIQNTVFAYLVLESGQGDEIEKERFPIRKHITTVGRLQSCDIRIYEETISRLHCQICVDDAGKLALQIFNPRGVRLNRQRIQKMASTSSAPNIYPLNETDILEMFTHRFRVEMPTAAEHKRKGGRKSFRLSLTKGADGSSKADMEEEEEGVGADMPEMDKENVPNTIKKDSPIKQKQHDVFSEDRGREPTKSRRSFTLKTPAKDTSRNGPWDSEPRKKIGRQGSLSPVKKSKPAPVIETRMSILEGGQIQEIPDAGVEGMNLEEELMGLSQEVATTEEDYSKKIAFQLHQAQSIDRLTQSASPKKKTKRRSSFFGRAGIFSGINFGFYPEERKDSEDEAAVENDIQMATTSQSDEIQRPVTPEPPLDSFGRPRLPRSLSSPSGYRSGSPSKRRVISLRTATLIKSGQIAHEQQKLLSPPSSPIKPAMSSLSMVYSTADAHESSEDESSSVDIAEQGTTLAAEKIPLPESDEDDAGDEDEVDKSLSSLMDDMDVEQENVSSTPPMLTKTKLTRRSRQSLAVISPSRKERTTGRSRASLPAKIKTYDNNQKTLEQWRKEGSAQIRPAKVHNIDEEAVDVEMTSSDELREKELKETDTQNLEMVSPQQLEKKNDMGDCNMLRHMIRNSQSLNSSLDEVTGQIQVDGLIEDNVSNCQAEADEEGNGVPAVDPLNGTEDVNIKIRSMSDSPVKVDQKVLRAIPKELLEPINKPTRRSSEIKSRGRNSLTCIATTPRKARKSAGAVLNTVRKRIQAPEGQMHSISEEKQEALPESKLNEIAVQEGEEAEVTEMQQSLPASIPRVDESQPASEPAINLSASPKKESKPRKSLMSSPRKRAASPPINVIDAQVITSRPKRAAKVAAAAAITGEGASLREREASSSPQKKIMAQSRRLRSVSKEPTSALTLLSSDDQSSRHLILDPSSPVKRTKRAAKNNAEEKIRAVLTKKPSIAALRDTKILSEAGHGLQRVNVGIDEKVEVSKSKATGTRKANTTVAPSRIPKKKVEAAIASKSEPATRSNRSRAAKK